jgi:hypothetical protein
VRCPGVEALEGGSDGDGHAAVAQPRQGWSCPDEEEVK